jgi:hypothetical protein
MSFYCLCQNDQRSLRQFKILTDGFTEHITTERRLTLHGINIIFLICHQTSVGRVDQVCSATQTEASVQSVWTAWIGWVDRIFWIDPPHSKIRSHEFEGKWADTTDRLAGVSAQIGFRQTRSHSLTFLNHSNLANSSFGSDNCHCCVARRHLSTTASQKLFWSTKCHVSHLTLSRYCDVNSLI